MELYKKFSIYTGFGLIFFFKKLYSILHITEENPGENQKRIISIYQENYEQAKRALMLLPEHAATPWLRGS